MRSRMFAVAVAVAAAAAVAEAKECKAVSGSFSAVPPATCESPVFICTHGTLWT